MASNNGSMFLIWTGLSTGTKQGNLKKWIGVGNGKNSFQVYMGKIICGIWIAVADNDFGFENFIIVHGHKRIFLSDI